MSANRKDVLRVAITGFDGLDNPHPGTPVSRALSSALSGKVEIHALGYETLTTAAWMPDVADFLHIVPLPADGDDAFFARLAEIHAEHGLDAIIPCLDLEVPVMARLAGRLESIGLKTLLPSPEVVYRTSKLRLASLCHEHDILTPRTIHVLELDDLSLHAQQFGFPLVVKSIVNGAKRVQDADEALAEARKLNKLWPGGVLLQEPVVGEEIVVAAVTDRRGDCLAMVPMRKLGINEDGKGILGAVIDDPTVSQRALEILGKIDWRGPLELEFIRPSGSDRMYLIEINCRFPSWIELSDWAGCNLPHLLLQEILGQKPRRSSTPRAGATFIRNVEETSVSIAMASDLQRFGSRRRETTKKNRRGAAAPATRVAVSGVGSLDVVHAGLGAARALRQTPGIVSVLGLGYGNFDSGLYRADLFDAGYCMPTSDDPAKLLDRLKEIHAENPFDVVIPCLDGEIPRYIEISRDLEALGVRTLLPGLADFERRQKVDLFTRLEQTDWTSFVMPETLLCRSADEVAVAVEQLGFPAVIKGPMSFAFPAETVAEARAAWARLRQKGCDEALVQPFIKGDKFAVATVFDQNHESLDNFSIKKLRMCERGSTWSAIHLRLPELERSFAEFLASLEWVGPAEGEFIRDETTETFYLIEVNPRFTAWIGFTADAGPNHPNLAVRAALGQTAEIVEGRRDLMFMRSCRDYSITSSAFASLATRGVLNHDSVKSLPTAAA